MSTFEFTGPDGKSYEVDGPQGSTPEQAFAVLQQQIGAQKPAAAEYDPTEGMSGLQRFAAGAGKAVMDIGRGIGQRAGLVDEADVIRSRTLDAPLMETGAGVAGNIAGNVGALFPASFVPGANTVTGAAVLGALSGAATPTAGNESVVENTLLGAGSGAAGQGVANAIGRLWQPVQQALPAGQQALADAAEHSGIALNAAQRTGSKPLQIIDSVLDKMPFTADKQAAAKAAQRSAWQRGILAKVGVDADTATPEVLSAARAKIGDAFEEIAARNKVNIGDEFLDSLADAEKKLTEFSPPAARAAIDKALQLAARADKVGGAISGRDYQTVRSSITKAADDAFASRSNDLGQTLKAIRSALDKAADDSISPEDAAAWMQARAQWRALARVAKASDSATGNISPKKLYSEMTRKDAAGMVYGKGDQGLPGLARIGKEFIAEQVADSGSAQRLLYQNLLTGGGGALGVGTIAGALPPAAALIAAAGYATPMAMQRALWSDAGKKWLTQGIKQLTPREKALVDLLRRGGVTGAASAPAIASANAPE